MLKVEYIKKRRKIIKHFGKLQRPRQGFNMGFLRRTAVY